jgi:MFS family permease
VGRKPVLLVVLGAQIVLIPLAVAWMVGQPALATFMVGSVLLAAAAGGMPSPGNAAVIESLPKHVRSRGFALIYSVPVTVFGGTTQLVVTWLIERTGSAMMVAWYPLTAMVLALVAVLFLRESAPGKQRSVEQQVAG